MEPEGSLPYPQEPATCPYPDPAQLSLTSWISNVVLSSHLRLDLLSGLFCSGLPPISPVCTPCESHTLDISFFLIWWPEKHLLHTVKLFLMESSPLPCYLFLLRPKYPRHSVLAQTPSAYVPPSTILLLLLLLLYCYYYRMIGWLTIVNYC